DRAPLPAWVPRAAREVPRVARIGGPRAGRPARGVRPAGRSAGSWGRASPVARRFLGRALMRPNIEPRGNERSNAFLSRVSPRSIPAGGTDLVVFRVM